jgi:uncharacterized membrane protein HdeD (DUF308 family)
MSEKKNSYIPGLILIIIGVVLLLHQLNVLYLNWRQIYPILLLILGGLFFVSVKTKDDKGAVFPGTVLIVLGLFFLVRNYGYFSFDYYFYEFEDFWPIFLVAVGLGFVAMYFFKPQDWAVLIPGGILLLFGIIFFLRVTGAFYWKDFAGYWPVILIAIGISMVINSMRHKTE